MSKRVLIVEKSLAVRGIAESLLRQNGFEVLTADSAETASEILSGNKLDLFLISSEIKDGSGISFYEYLGSESKTSVVPLLILHDPALGELPFPPEAIISKPFTPRDFLAIVSVFCGEIEMKPQDGEAFQGSDLEDDIIDAALGLDKIEVDGSAVMEDDTAMFQKKSGKNIPESMIGFESKNGKEETSSGKIAQVKVKAVDDSQSIERPDAEPEPKPVASKDNTFLGVDSSKLPSPKPAMSESSKIEIVTDQYGLAQSPEGLEPEAKEAGGHDYDWFINEMKGVTGKDKANLKDTGSTNIKPNAEVKAPPQETHQSQPQETTQPVDPGPENKTEHGEAVDKFISDFKKEMEKITEEPSGGVPIKNLSAPVPPEISSFKWQESTGGGTARIGTALSEEKMDEITRRIIDKIFIQISRETLYRIIREAISEST